jgi:glycosyltransferase involved in cell wall biosynthesis
MRVLFLNHNVVGSGTFFRAFHFARQLVTRGCQVTLVTTSRAARLHGRSYERDGVQMFEAPDWLPGRARTGWDPYNTWVRRAFVRKQAFDIVHAFDSRPAVIYPALSAATRKTTTFVMDWADWWGKGGWIQERSGWLMRNTFGPVEAWYEEAFRTRAHGMTVASRALAGRSAALGIAAERIELLPGGCEAQSVQWLSRADARSQLGIPSQLPLVLHVGVLTPGDYVYLREAFARVRRNNPHAALVLAGRTGIRVRRSDAEIGAIATGEVATDTLRAWLAAADVCVIPCRDTIGNRGRWPSKVNDYLTAGRAVVMPRVSDAATLIEQAGAGWSTDVSAAAFAAGIVHALANRVEADAAGERGRHAAEGELAWPRLTDRLVSFYDRLAGLR